MSVEGLEILAVDWKAVEAHLDACLPEEGCGLFAGRLGRVGLVLPIENIDHSPVHFRMEPRALVTAILCLEDLGLELLGVFHSHPVGPIGVSATDVREWRYPEAALVVCNPQEDRWVGRAYWVDDGGTRETRLTIDER